MSWIVQTNGNVLFPQAHIAANGGVFETVGQNDSASGDSFEDLFANFPSITNVVNFYAPETIQGAYSIYFTLQDSTSGETCTTNTVTISSSNSSTDPTLNNPLNALLLLEQNQTQFAAGDSVDWQIETAASVIDPTTGARSYTPENVAAYAYLMTPNGLESTVSFQNSDPISRSFGAQDVGDMNLIYLVKDANGNSAFSNVLSWSVSPQGTVPSVSNQIQPNILYSDGTATITFNTTAIYASSSNGGNNNICTVPIDPIGSSGGDPYGSSAGSIGSSGSEGYDAGPPIGFTVTPYFSAATASSCVMEHLTGSSPFSVDANGNVSGQLSYAYCGCTNPSGGSGGFEPEYECAINTLQSVNYNVIGKVMIDGSITLSISPADGTLPNLAGAPFVTASGDASAVAFPQVYHLVPTYSNNYPMTCPQSMQ